MKNLNEDLKTGNIKQAYLLYGEEAYLKKQYRDRLTKAVLPEGDTVNYAHYEGKGINVPEIIDLAETMPFFAEKRLIVMEDSGLFKNADAKFADYIKSMPETVCFVFVNLLQIASVVRIHLHPFSFSGIFSKKRTYHIQHNIAGWSSLEARRAHNPKVIGSNPVPATKI